jgi:two-component system, OmpR family, phosphate regulon response regulator PhoB
MTPPPNPATASALTLAIVDDDGEQRSAVSAALAPLGACHTFANAELLFAKIQAGYTPTVLLLDWGLPGMSGLAALKALRKQGLTVPVLFLTSRDSERDVVSALNAGADDYLVKPFRAGELTARVKTLLRRAAPEVAGQLAALAVEDVPLTAAHLGVVLDRTRSAITMPGQTAVDMTQREFELAVFLFEHLNQPVSREAVMQAVWRHGEIAESRTLDTHMSKLRNKLNLRPDLGWRLTPVYSFGYRLDYQVGD